ncbi:MAG TPA: hypothetical protein VKR38_14605 [Usitatibacter sp.]|nr:hypothetical protein [Usitatibacter sp.]
MTQDTLLDLKLDELRSGLSAVHAPDSLEGALVAKFRSRPQRPRLWWMPPLALAATIALASWIVRGPVPANEGIVSLAPTTIDSDPPFLALRPLASISKETGARVVSSEFPRAMLADWGLPVSPERAGEPVRAEMLYSARGEPLAVRLLN